MFTHEQWRMNQIADRHAKEAAAEVRHPEEAVRKRHLEEIKVATMADWIGRATFAANNGNEEGLRDTTATRKNRVVGEMREKKKKKEGVEVSARPVQLGGHTLEKEGGEWRCVVCWKRSQNWERMARGRCDGSAARMWAKRAMVLGGQGGTDGAGHWRAAYGNLTWCLKCGAYAEKWAVGLAAPCRGQPSAPSQVRVLNRLKRGRHPRSNEVLEDDLVLETPRREGIGMEGGGWGRAARRRRAQGRKKREEHYGVPEAAWRERSAGNREGRTLERRGA